MSTLREVVLSLTDCSLDDIFSLATVAGLLREHVR